MARLTKGKHKKKAVLSRKDYDKELRRLQVDLVQLEEGIRPERAASSNG
jgi:hypothetical protein